MARFTNNLDNIRVAAPCSADWDSMFGNERVRLCEQCHLNVYNLSAMSRVEADRLINQTEGRLCVRFYRRRDGSIITQNCPVGLRAIKRRLSRVATAVVSFILSLMAGVGFYRVIERVMFRPHVMGAIASADGNMSRSLPLARPMSRFTKKFRRSSNCPTSRDACFAASANRAARAIGNASDRKCYGRKRNRRSLSQPDS